MNRGCESDSSGFNLEGAVSRVVAHPTPLSDGALLEDSGVPRGWLHGGQRFESSRHDGH